MIILNYKKGEVFYDNACGSFVNEYGFMPSVRRTLYRFLKKKTIGQYILDVAPEAHAKKQAHRQPAVFL